MLNLCKMKYIRPSAKRQEINEFRKIVHIQKFWLN